MSQLPRLSGSIRERFSHDQHAYDQGSRKVLADKKALARQFAQPLPMAEAGAATLDGLMDINERKSQVVMAIKEVAVKTKEVSSTLDIYA